LRPFCCAKRLSEALFSTNHWSTCNVWFMKLSGHFDVSTQSALSTDTDFTYVEQLYSGLLC
jgi:hypothetical protein